jgi:hypothetical protein
MDASVDVFGPGTKFCHDASLEKVRRAQRHLSPAICPWEERADSDSLGFQSFASLFNMDQFARRNEALLNTAFLHLARFSTKTTDGSNNILCTKELPSDEGARSQFRWRSPLAIQRCGAICLVKVARRDRFGHGAVAKATQTKVGRHSNMLLHHPPAGDQHQEGGLASSNSLISTEHLS